MAKVRDTRFSLNRLRVSTNLTISCVRIQNDGKGIEWTIKDGIPYHAPTMAADVRALVAKARETKSR